MRKADYQLLAQSIREKLNESNEVASPHIRAFAVSLLTELARDFAASASVDRAAFLKACGIDT
jgi:hypothetical protein